MLNLTLLSRVTRVTCYCGLVTKWLHLLRIDVSLIRTCKICIIFLNKYACRKKKIFKKPILFLIIFFFFFFFFFLRGSPENDQKIIKKKSDLSKFVKRNNNGMRVLFQRRPERKYQDAEKTYSWMPNTYCPYTIFKPASVAQ